MGREFSSWPREINDDCADEPEDKTDGHGQPREGEFASTGESEPG